MAAVHPIRWRQIKALTSASIKSRYRNTVAGVLWVVMSPLLMFSAQGYVFKKVLQINYANYPLFLLTGLMPWIFLTQSTSMSTTLFVSNARLFKSFPIHPMASLISILADNLINFALTFVVILGGLVLFGDAINVWHFLLMPLAFLPMFIAVVGLCSLLATLQVFFHDVKFITDFVLSVLFFLTPIFYPAQFVPPGYQWVITYNPVAILLSPIQNLSQDLLAADYFWLLGESWLVAFISIAVAWLFWSRKKNEIYFRL